ncbi:MAG: type I DNA topoisomerase [Firmicutes bacterium]|nr:type I DNA topoisomerase [Bacillota bacterium]
MALGRTAEQGGTSKARPLIIVESPAKARTIEKMLGREYRVMASMGHVRDLPRSRLGVDVENGFTPRYITIRGKGEVVEALRREAARAPRVVLATDPDREGEAISWHLAQLLSLGDGDALRVEFPEITRQVVREAVKHPRPLDMKRVESQQARRILDRLVGYKLSPLLWEKVRSGLSAGRVQSVALRLLVDREREIAAFQPQEYWTLTAHLKTAAGRPFRARFWGTAGEKVELRSEADTRAVMGAAEKEVFRVAKVTRRQRRRSPAAPFTTSTLQQEAYRKLGFAVRRTMAVAQQLYEGLDLGPAGRTGLITYMRTDSTRVSQEAVAAATALIRNRYGQEYAAGRPRAGARKPGEQGAHEAIRPTSVERDPDSVRPYLTPEQYRLYRLIWERFLASVMTDAVYDQVVAEIEAGAHQFRASGSTLRFPGFLVLYSEGRDEDAPTEEEEGELPPLTEGEVVSLVSLEPSQHFTQPPPRYTEATLVKALEEKGIGRPSTYAPILAILQEREYVRREGGRLVPTELGTVVVDLLREHFPDVVDVDFTARVEERLDQVEEGTVSWQDVVRDFWGPFSASLQKAEKDIPRVRLAEEETGETCPLCGRPLVVRRGRFGKFLACSGYPECTHTQPLVIHTGVTCPECGKGELVEKKSRKGRTFWGCDRYPECRYSVWHRPVPEKCPRCGHFLVEVNRKGGRVLECGARCGYRASPTPPRAPSTPESPPEPGPDSKPG